MAEDRTLIVGSGEVSARADEPLPLGFEVGDYVIHGVLGRGGFARVYEATHRTLGRVVAIKVLHPEAHRPVMVQRFIREAQVVARIAHPNIIDVFDLGTLSDGRPYFVMERLRGRDLSRVIKLRGRLQMDEVLQMIEPVCLALEAAHEAGVVHRDLKAANVFITDDEPPRVKLLDFGVAKLLFEDPETGLSVSGEQIGTPTTMAPEQIRGETVTAQTDVYALGALLFRMLTGRHAFDVAERTDARQQRMLIEALHLGAPPPRPSAFAAVTPAVDAVVLRAMEKAPSARFPSARALLEALKAAAGHAPAADTKSDLVARGVAIYVEVALDEAALEDEQALLDSATFLEGSERIAFQAGLDPQLETGNALLSVRLLPRAKEEAAPLRAQAVRAAEEIYALRATLDPRLIVRVLVQVGALFVRPNGERLEITGGPLLRIDDWLMPNAPGLHVGDRVLQVSSDST